MNSIYLRQNYIKLFLFCTFSLIGCNVIAADLEINDAWARATLPGRMGAVYLEIKNTTELPIVIESVSCSVARIAEIHESYLTDGMMRMRHMPDLKIPAGTEKKLTPGHLHVMLMGLEKALVEGSEFTVSFRLKSSQTISFPVKVGSMGQMKAP